MEQYRSRIWQVIHRLDRATLENLDKSDWSAAILENLNQDSDISTEAMQEIEAFLEERLSVILALLA